MGDLNDFVGFEDKLDRELDRLDEHHPEDRPHLKRFITKQDGRLEPSSMYQYLRNIRLTGNRLGRPITTLSEIEFDEHIYDLRNSAEYGRGDSRGVSDSTARNVQAAIRALLTTVYSDDEDHWAHDYDYVVVNDADTPTGDEMLSSEDIQDLIDGANNVRDVALIEFLADTGVRRTLAGSLRVGDVDLDGDTATFRPNPNATGLKGADIKDYPLIDCVATLRNYLRTTHPRPDRDDVALFHKMSGAGYEISEDDDGSMSPGNMRKQLMAAADRGGVDRPVNPHNFRHSAVTRMRREGYTRSEVEHRVCWEVDSDMWQVYEHITAAEHNDSIFEKAGVVDDGDAEDPVRETCGNCHEAVAPYHQYCPRCGSPVTPETRDVFEQAQDSMVDDLREIDDAELRNLVADMMDRVRDRPDSLGHHESPSSSSN